jgi:hypothetical protein
VRWKDIVDLVERVFCDGDSDLAVECLVGEDGGRIPDECVLLLEILLCVA